MAAGPPCPGSPAGQRGDSEGIVNLADSDRQRAPVPLALSAPPGGPGQPGMPQRDTAPPNVKIAADQAASAQGASTVTGHSWSESVAGCAQGHLRQHCRRPWRLPTAALPRHCSRRYCRRCRRCTLAAPSAPWARPLPAHAASSYVRNRRPRSKRKVFRCRGLSE
jgi:hypothetical protein